MTEFEMITSCKHFSERKIPFEDKIVDIAEAENIPYWNRKEWIENLSFVLKKGYYIRYKDFYSANTHYDEEDNQPFAVYLDGVLKIAYVYAFNSDKEDTIKLILEILSKGIICTTKYIRGKHIGKYHFSFSLPWYSLISKEEREN